ncbi:MAG: hypothetical protein RLZZ387_2642 [Chloroflexota bacterium]|jgi:uncharacterized protein YbjT (DUF2867 family)
MNDVDYQVLFNIVFAVAGFLGGWVLNNLAKSIERLDADVRAMPHTYVSKDDWRDAMKEMKEEMRSGFDKLDKTLGTIFKKIDGKEDKAK